MLESKMGNCVRAQFTPPLVHITLGEYSSFSVNLTPYKEQFVNQSAIRSNNS